MTGADQPSGASGADMASATAGMTSATAGMAMAAASAGLAEAGRGRPDEPRRRLLPPFGVVGPPLGVAVLIVAAWYLVSYVVLDPTRRFLLPPPHDVVLKGFIDGDARADILAAGW